MAATDTARKTFSETAPKFSEQNAGATNTEQAKHTLSDLQEPVLPDDYPIYAGYLYVADGKVVRSDWHGITARQFKAREGVSELRRCDIEGRRALSKAEA